MEELADVVSNDPPCVLQQAVGMLGSLGNYIFWLLRGRIRLPSWNEFASFEGHSYGNLADFDPRITAGPPSFNRETCLLFVWHLAKSNHAVRKLPHKQHNLSRKTHENQKRHNEKAAESCMKRDPCEIRGEES